MTYVYILPERKIIPWMAFVINQVVWSVQSQTKLFFYVARACSNDNHSSGVMEFLHNNQQWRFSKSESINQTTYGPYYGFPKSLPLLWSFLNKKLFWGRGICLALWSFRFISGCKRFHPAPLKGMRFQLCKAAVSTAMLCVPALCKYQWCAEVSVIPCLRHPSTGDVLHTHPPMDSI